MGKIVYPSRWHSKKKKNLFILQLDLNHHLLVAGKNGGKMWLTTIPLRHKSSRNILNKVSTWVFNQWRSDGKRQRFKNNEKGTNGIESQGENLYKMLQNYQMPHFADFGETLDQHFRSKLSLELNMIQTNHFFLVEINGKCYTPSY